MTYGISVQNMFGQTQLTDLEFAVEYVTDWTINSDTTASGSFSAPSGFTDANAVAFNTDPAVTCWLDGSTVYWQNIDVVGSGPQYSSAPTTVRLVGLL